MQYALLVQLNDCQFHSGEALAKKLGVTRAAVWKHLKSLQAQFDIELYALSGKGYRLPEPIELLDKTHIDTALRKEFNDVYVETFLSIESTNQYLLSKVAQGETGTFVVLAEHQTAGRGRRGRSWVSPFGANLYLSLLYQIKQPAQGLMGLSLAIALAISRALHELMGINVQLKWPNDILYQGKKLCGILLELQGESYGPAAVVVGIGLNVRLSSEDKKQIDQPSIALQDIVANKVARNLLAIGVIKHVLSVMLEFEQVGLTRLLSEWQRQDAFLDRPVSVQLGNNVIEGISRGIDENGALLVEINGQVQRYYSGEISLQVRQ